MLAMLYSQNNIPLMGWKGSAFKQKNPASTALKIHRGTSKILQNGWGHLRLNNFLAQASKSLPTLSRDILIQSP